jgi:UDP-N-acetyl-D-galactosamine dehydrogenase
VGQVDAVILAVAHKEYENMDLEEIKKKYRNGKYVLIDVKGICSIEKVKDAGFIYWRL